MVSEYCHKRECTPAFGVDFAHVMGCLVNYYNYYMGKVVLLNESYVQRISLYNSWIYNKKSSIQINTFIS